jgi:hypothetical protein
VLAELRAEADRAERARLKRKARSEAIPTAPKGTQDPVIFQARDACDAIWGVMHALIGV